MKKKKNKAPLFILIAGVVLIIAAILFLPNLSKVGDAIRPTVEKAPDVHLRFTKFTYFGDFTPYKTYVSAIFFPNTKHLSHVGVTYNTRGSTDSHYSNNNSFSSSLFVQNVENEFIDVSGNLSINNYYKYFNTNINNNFVANYDYLFIDVENKLLSFSGELESNTFNHFNVGLHLYDKNNNLLVYDSISVNQIYGDFNQIIDISQVFPTNLVSGDYILKVYVQAQLDKHKISNVNNYMFTSNAISAAYFTVKNNDIVNVSNIPAEELNDFANNEVLTKKANVKYTK